MKKILVTGATGSLGGSYARPFQQATCPSVGPTHQRPLLPPPPTDAAAIEIVYRDVTDYSPSSLLLWLPRHLPRGCRRRALAS
ncbi:hypothetical protein CFP56_029147 [Quercus suber]|uniref:Uncharacterized protein n=1 Tax=Quercus suber TaxID=58331 RepID=A0AAW0MCN3_QUESU